MAIVPIQLGKGAFQNVDPTELADPSSAFYVANLQATDAGSVTDRPALRPFATIGTYPIIGAAFFSDRVVAIDRNRRVYAVDSTGVVTDITGSDPLEGLARPIFEQDGTYLAIAGGGEPKRWDGSGDTEAMPGTPPDTTHLAYLDGYWIAFLEDDQEMRFAGPTAALREVWDTSNFFAAESNPDPLRAIVRNQRELFAMGRESIEIFQNFGDTSVPFRPTLSIDEHGLGDSTYSLVKADNTLWWFDSINRQVKKLDGRTPTFISSPFDRVFRGLETVSDCIGARVDVGGYYVLVWTFPEEQRSFAFDYKNQQWSEWTGYQGDREVRFRGNTFVHAKAWNKTIVGDYRNGTLWELSTAAKQDGSNPLKRVWRTGYYDHGTAKKKQSNYYLFTVKRGVGTPGGVNPVFWVRYRDDGGQWSDPETFELGFPGELQTPIKVTSCRGIYSKRQLEFGCTDNCEFLLSKLEEDVAGLRT
jgi:hypothetical protein